MKNILLAVVGLTPQVITETLYALHQQGRHVDEIHVITTRRGKEIINAHLLSPVDGHYYRYLREYGIKPSQIEFGHGNIHTVKDGSSFDLDDIMDEQSNEKLLELCLNLTFRFTGDPQAAVFFSIAGGRKSMSACMMTAAHLYGRPQDRVYHVLVSPEFESNRDFYYPPLHSKPLELVDIAGQVYVKETRFARVFLNPIPFISVRDQIENAMLKKPRDPATLMLSMIKEKTVHLTIDLSACKIIFGGRELDLAPARLALYAFMTQVKLDCRRDGSCRRCTDCFLEAGQIVNRNPEIAELYKKIVLTRDFEAMRQASDGGIMNLDAANFNSYRSRIRRDLERGLGMESARSLEIAVAGRRPNTRYGIPFERTKIFFAD